MRKLAMLMLSFMMMVSLSACDTDGITSPEVPQKPGNEHESMKLKITVGSATFTASLRDNTTVDAFKKLLPMTIKMSEWNNDEKYYDLPNSLPINSFNPKTIQPGDLMLFGTQTFVLFYKGSSTSYSYTPLGKVDDTTGLISALGSGDIAVSFELE